MPFFEDGLLGSNSGDAMSVQVWTIFGGKYTRIILCGELRNLHEIIQILKLSLGGGLRSGLTQVQLGDPAGEELGPPLISAWTLVQMNAKNEVQHFRRTTVLRQLRPKTSPPVAWLYAAPPLFAGPAQWDTRPPRCTSGRAT